jgi:hypothetical protein
MDEGYRSNGRRIQEQWTKDTGAMDEGYRSNGRRIQEQSVNYFISTIYMNCPVYGGQKDEGYRKPVSR